MPDLEEIEEAARRLPPDEFDDVFRLIWWIASQPETEEEACARVIDDYARLRGLRLKSASS